MSGPCISSGPRPVERPALTVPAYLDLQAVQAAHSGCSTTSHYLLELALAVERQAPGRVSGYLLNPQLPVPALLEPLHRTGRLVYVDRLECRGPSIQHLAVPLAADAVLDHVGGRWVRLGGRLVVSVTDCRAITGDPAPADRLAGLRTVTTRELVRGADCVLAASPSIAAAVAELGVPNARVRVIGAGVAPQFVPATSQTAAHGEQGARHPWLRPGFVLASVSSDPDAALAILRGYGRLDPSARAGHQLVVLGRFDRSSRGRIERELTTLGLGEEAVFPGSPERGELVRLYQSCALFALVEPSDAVPLAALEALGSGAVVVGSDTGSTRALLPPDALFANRAESIERGLGDALRGDPSRHASARAVGDLDRDWTATVADLLDVYRDLETVGRLAGRRRAQIAVVTPLPPQRTGVATYSARLLEKLRDHVDVDVFVDAEPSTLDVPSGVAAYRSASFDAVERVRGGYDGVLCCLGNNPFHWSALEILRRRQATVLAHDLRLAWLYFLSEGGAANRIESLEELLREQYGAPIDDLLRRSSLTGYEVDQYGIYMAREALRLSGRYLVHSLHAAQLARLDADPGDESKVEVVPFGHPPVATAETRPGTEPLVASFGFPSKAKQSDKLIDTFELVARTVPGARLAIVGSLGADTEEVVAATVARAGLGRRLQVTGWIPEDEYQAWLRRATVAVQLREYTNGESSAAIADCFSAGLPTIVSDTGASAELPDAAVVKVPRDVSTATLSEEIVNLLSDDPRRSSMSLAALEFARRNAFSVAADAILEATTDVGPGVRPRTATPLLAVREGYEPPGPKGREVAQEAGVNLVGPFTAESEQGDMARALAAVIAEVGIPHVRVTYHAVEGTGTVAFRDDGWPAARHDVNILCVDRQALEAIAAAAPQFFAGRYSIAVGDEPAATAPDTLGVIDEHWATSDFQSAELVRARLVAVWSSYGDGTNSISSKRTPSSR